MKKRLIFALIILAVVGVSLFSRPKNSVHAEDTRVITIHLDGEERTVASNGATVKDVLQKLGTNLGQHDKTEPQLSEPVKGNDFTINVYRARPITVVDGANNYTVMTAERSPSQIAKDAGFETKQEDQFGFKRSDDPFEGAPGTQMVIKRSKSITLDLYGTTSTLNTNETTVSELLKDRGVALAESDEVNVPLEARIVEGMTVSIASISKTVETVEEVAPFPEEKILDAQQPTSYRKIQTPGKDGKKLVTYETVARNGGEPVRAKTQEVITEEPVKQVVVIGAEQIVHAPGSCGTWLAQAGITDADAVWLISKESGCNPNAVNRRSGACGIPQALPCSKMGPVNPDGTSAVAPVNQLQWMNNYVMNRYKSWAGARAHHAARGWY